MQMNAAEYRESLRRYKPRVWVDGERIESVADAPPLQPGINAMGVTYDYALRDDLAPVMRAVQASSGKNVNRMLHTDSSSADLLNKLEAVRILCQETGCAQRYLAHDALQRAAADDRAGRCRDRLALRRALPRLPARLPGQGPDPRHRHDRRQGRPQQAAARAGQPRQLRPHRRAQRQGPRHLGHQGDRHRRALHARVPGHAEPQHDRGRRRLRRLLRRALRRRRPDHRRPPGRPARREGGALFQQVRPVDRRARLRPRVRALGAGVPAPANGSTRPS